MKECRKQNEGHVALQGRPASHLACKERRPHNSKRCKKRTQSKNKSKHVCLCYTITRNVYLSEVPIAQIRFAWYKERGQQNTPKKMKTRRDNKKRKAQSGHTHIKKSIFPLKQRIILHCNSLQILSIPTHTARQGSHCSDRKTARCNKRYIKKPPHRVQEQKNEDNRNDEAATHEAHKHIPVWLAFAAPLASFHWGTAVLETDAPRH